MLISPYITQMARNEPMSHEFDWAETGRFIHWRPEADGEFTGPVFSMWFFDLVLPNHRKLEDKLLNHRLEFRTFFLPMDLSQLHHNREMPAGFTFFLCVSDTTLPAKGTAHRANRNAGKVRGSKQSHSKHPWINFPVKGIYEYIYIYYTTYIIL